MAFEAIRPHEAQIFALIDQGRTLAQVAEALQTLHGVKTTPATLSRFMAEQRPARTPRPAAPPIPQPYPQPQPYPPAYPAPVAHSPLLDAILAEVRAGRDENHSIQEVIAGKVAALSADVVELEKAITSLQEQHTRLVETLGKPTPAPTTIQTGGATVTPRTLTRIWSSAAVITFLLWGAILGLIIVAASGR